jgi:signal transduction histidine kinase
VRRRVTWLVAAITSAVVIAFLVPLAFLLRTLAEDRAVAAATARAQTLLAVAGGAFATPGTDAVRASTSGLTGNQGVGRVTLYLFRTAPTAQRVVVGPDVPDAGVAQAQARAESSTRRGVPTVVYATSVLTRGGERWVLVARTEISEGILHQGVERAIGIVAVLGLLVLLAAILAADRLARRITAPLHELADVADGMREGPLDTRVPEDGPPEVVALAVALNRLAARVRQLLANERDAVADLSHRLRTPVTALKLDTEFVTEPDVAERLRGHVTQLERTVDAIVHDARRPSRSPQVMATPSCDAGRVVGERVAFWSALAEDQGRPLRLALPDRPLRAKLGAADLADVVDVLIDNVFAHTDDGVPVEIWVVPRADGAVVLTVEDAGPGLPSVDIIDRGRSHAGSTGLGLDIVRRAALASGGSLELGRSRLGGALVRLVLGRADD